MSEGHKQMTFREENKMAKCKKCNKEEATQPDDLCDNCYDNSGEISDQKMNKCIECGTKEVFGLHLVKYHKDKGYPPEDWGWYCPVCEY